MRVRSILSVLVFACAALLLAPVGSSDCTWNPPNLPNSCLRNLLSNCTCNCDQSTNGGAGVLWWKSLAVSVIVCGDTNPNDGYFYGAHCTEANGSQTCGYGEA